jgi:hypothetical protein
MLILHLFGLFLPLTACGRGDPLAPTVTRESSRARPVPRPPPRPDTIVIGLPVEPLPLDPVLDGR